MISKSKLPIICLPDDLVQVLAAREDLNSLFVKHLADAEAFYEVFAQLVYAEQLKRGIDDMSAAKLQAARALPEGIYDQIENR